MTAPATDPPPSPYPPVDFTGPWLDDPVVAALPAPDPLAGTTTGGLPYPDSTGPLNQGANDIKALALAVDARGGGFKTARGYSTAASNGGRPPPISLTAAGFTAIGGVLITPYWGQSSPVPATVAVESGATNVNQLGVLIYCPPTPGSGTNNSDWYTGPMQFSWFIWGV